MEIFYLIIASIFIMFASLSGKLFVMNKFGQLVQNNLKYLTTFASGVFLVVSFDMVSEAINSSDNNIIVLISILAGFLLFFFIESMYPEIHCHHDSDECVQSGNRRGAHRVLVGDAFHNAGDGILLAPIFLLDIKLGFITAFGIFIHEVVQEVSEFFVLKAAGYSDREALVKNFIVSSTILIGAIGGFYIASFQGFVAPLVGFAAGAFGYILFVDLLPETIRSSRHDNKYFTYIMWGVFGMVLISVINLFASG